jgi:AAA+ ATPase superfamily predicted ATPase
MNNKENSPFTPGNPVPIELFVGRSEQINEVTRYIKQASAGKQENVFLTGERGIGKSSFASVLRHFAASEQNALGIHVFLGRVSSLDDMVRHVFEQVLKVTKEQKWFEKIRQFFGENIQQVGLLGISLGFNPPNHELQRLVSRFPEALYNLLTRIKDEQKALFIALDDVNGLAEKPEFANWYKSFVDEVATHYEDFPVFTMLVGLPEKRDKLASLQPSLMRIFRVVEIEKLSDDEVRHFLFQAFKTANLTVTEEAMDLMVRYSSGLPVLMQEIGDATFWEDSDGTVDRRDAVNGIMLAAERIGKKYLDPKVYGAIRSQRYRSILRKLARMPISRHFAKRDAEAMLNIEERRVLHNFLKKLRELGIIESDRERGPGVYRFANEIYPVYIRMESERFKRQSSSSKD